MLRRTHKSRKSLASLGSFVTSCYGVLLAPRGGEGRGGHEGILKDLHVTF